MLRFKLHQALLNAVKDNYMDNPLTGIEQSNYDLAEASESVPAMCDCLLSAGGFRQQFRALVESIRDIIHWGELETKNARISGIGLKSEVDVVFWNPSYKRNYSIFDHDLTCFNADRLNESNCDEKLISAIEKICLAESRRIRLLDMINRSAVNSFCITYAPDVLLPGVGIMDVHRLYSFGLLRYINRGNTIAIPTDLSGRTPVLFNAALSYVDALEYEQYLDIYDVMNEWQHATDYLTSFMKMYQVMEFIAYRCQLSDLVDKNDIRHSFLRSVKNLDNDYHKKERDTFIKQLSPVFNDFSSCVAIVTNSVEDFVEQHLAHDADNPKRYLQQADGGNIARFAKRILKFIYDVRCSIVHNKDSELHFTFNNVSEYDDLIPLMKQIEVVVGEKLIETLLDVNSPIKYGVNHLDLY